VRPLLFLDVTQRRLADCVWSVMAHAQKPDFFFRRNGRVHLNRRGLQFSRLLAAAVCASAEVMLDTPCSEVVWRVLTTHSIRQFPLHFPSSASPCAITFQLDSINYRRFGTRYRFHIQESRSPGRRLKTGPIGCPVTSVSNYKSVPPNATEEGKSHILHVFS